MCRAIILRRRWDTRCWPALSCGRWRICCVICGWGDVLLFGSFLAWSVLAFVASRRRDRADGVRYSAGTLGASALVLALGVGAWAWFAMVGHGRLIGIRPFG